jgi:arylsulfatase
VIPEGRICNKLASTIDIFPTVAAITGTTLPDHKIDGVDISSLLKGEANANPREEFLYYYTRNKLEAVRKGNWKLVYPHPHRSYGGVLPRNDGWPGPYNKTSVDSLELYNLIRDPGERYNVIEMYPEIVEELKEIGDRARLDLGDALTGVRGSGNREPGRISEP